MEYIDLLLLSRGRNKYIATAKPLTVNTGDLVTKGSDTVLYKVEKVVRMVDPDVAELISGKVFVREVGVIYRPVGGEDDA